MSFTTVGKVFQSLGYLFRFLQLDQMAGVLHHEPLRIADTGLNRVAMSVHVRDVGVGIRVFRFVRLLSPLPLLARDTRTVGPRRLPGHR